AAHCRGGRERDHRVRRLRSWRSLPVDRGISGVNTQSTSDAPASSSAQASTSAAARGRQLVGVVLVVAAVSSFSVLDSFAKHLSQQYPLPMVIWARYFIHAAIMVALLWPRMGPRLIATQRPGLQLARGAVLGFSTLFFVTGLSMMPLAEASAITLIAPILLTL